MNITSSWAEHRSTVGFYGELRCCELELTESAVIKSGGYKLSALDIEREITGLDYTAETVVVGVEDEEYGQKVAAAVVLRKDVSHKCTTSHYVRPLIMCTTSV